MTHSEVFPDGSGLPQDILLSCDANTQHHLRLQLCVTCGVLSDIFFATLSGVPVGINLSVCAILFVAVK